MLRRCLSSLATSTSHAALFRARVNTLLFGADRLLLTPRADALEAYFMARLSDDKFHNTYRSMAFMRTTRFCLERHLFDVAIALHRRMLAEGFVPVHALALRMAALSLVQQAPTPREAVPRLKKLFETPSYDVPAFMDLVHYLSDRASGALIDDLAHAFVSTRAIQLSEHPDLVGELASINMRAGRLDAARAWLKVFEDTCDVQGILPDVVPYADIITTFNAIDPTNADGIQDVLERMKSAGVSPDTTVFNALIRVNLVQKRYPEAFALYHVLMEKRSDQLMPNDVTYKMLFRAIHILGRPRVTRRHGRPENVIEPRSLFREMLTCHLERTGGQPLGRSTVLSVSAFHLALRVFMARDDYAAAFVVIRALHTFGFQPNLQTYLIVVVSLLDRLKRDARLPRPEDACRLVDFLTHLRPNEDPDLPTLVHRIQSPPPPIGTDTIAHLLALGQHPHTDADLPHVPTLSRSHARPTRMPTAAMLTGAEHVDARTGFSDLPLARIVYKALLGELFRKAMRRGADWDWRGAARQIIAETGGAMVPPGIAPAATGPQGSEAERRRPDVLPFAAARMRRRRRGARGGREIAFGED